MKPYASQSYPVIARYYRLTDEGRRAWADYLLGERLAAKCEHEWINHYSSVSECLPDVRVCKRCGESELLTRPTRFPDLRDQLTGQTLRTLDSVKRAPWYERIWSKFCRGLANIADFLFFRS